MTGPRSSAYNPKRFIGMALISLADIELGAQELRRAQKIGLRGAMIWGSAPQDKPFWHPMYDPFWTTAQELEMPLSLHVITGGPNSRGRKNNPLHPEEFRPRMKGLGALTGYMTLSADVCCRFPKSSWAASDAFPAPEAGLGGKRLRLDSPFHVSDGPRVREVRRRAGAAVYQAKRLRAPATVATFQDDPIGPLIADYSARTVTCGHRTIRTPIRRSPTRAR